MGDTTFSQRVQHFVVLGCLMFTGWSVCHSSHPVNFHRIRLDNWLGRGTENSRYFNKALIALDQIQTPLELGAMLLFSRCIWSPITSHSQSLVLKNQLKLLIEVSFKRLCQFCNQLRNFYQGLCSPLNCPICPWTFWTIQRAMFRLNCPNLDNSAGT
jgi:hypothetical protein